MNFTLRFENVNIYRFWLPENFAEEILFRVFFFCKKFLQIELLFYNNSFGTAKLLHVMHVGLHAFCLPGCKGNLYRYYAEFISNRLRLCFESKGMQFLLEYKRLFKGFMHLNFFLWDQSIVVFWLLKVNKSKYNDRRTSMEFEYFFFQLVNNWHCFSW